MLCSNFNKKRGNRFEDEYLIKSLDDYLKEPYSINTVKFIKLITKFGHKFYTKYGFLPKPQDLSDEFVQGKLSPMEETAAKILLAFANYMSTFKDFYYLIIRS